MKHFIFLFITVLLFSCNENKITADASCEVKITHDDKQWDLLNCEHSAIYKDRWSLTLNAKRTVHKDYRHTEELLISNIPFETGKYSLEYGQQIWPDLTRPSLIRLLEWQGDMAKNHRTLDLSADNYIRIDRYDPATGKIEGSFYSEWKKTDAEVPGPDRQIVKSDYFEFYLSEVED